MYIFKAIAATPQTMRWILFSKALCYLHDRLLKESKK